MAVKRVGVIFLAIAAGAGAAFAHGGATGVVKERMDTMSEFGKQVKTVGKMLKGGTYDPAQVSSAGEVIASHAGEALVTLFPDDSDHSPSEASPAIWTEWSKFQAYAGDLQVAALTLKDLADDGADRKEIAGAFGALAGTCKACHEAFRIKK